MQEGFFLLVVQHPIKVMRARRAPVQQPVGVDVIPGRSARHVAHLRSSFDGRAQRHLVDGELEVTERIRDQSAGHSDCGCHSRWQQIQAPSRHPRPCVTIDSKRQRAENQEWAKSVNLVTRRPALLAAPCSQCLCARAAQCVRRAHTTTLGVCSITSQRTSMLRNRGCQTMVNTW